MKLKAKVLFSEKFSFNNQQYVKIQGSLENMGLFDISVKENLVPDSIEGKTVNLDYEVGLIKFKPVLKLKSITII